MGAGGTKTYLRVPTNFGQQRFLIAFAIYETFLLQMVKIVDGVAEKKFRSTKGVGFSKFIEYFRQFETNILDLAFGSQILSASKIRNCIIHSFGIMSLSDKNLEIKKIVETKSYLRDGWSAESLPARVDPTISILGEREDLVVGMGYPFHFAALAKDNLHEILDKLIFGLGR